MTAANAVVKNAWNHVVIVVAGTATTSMSYLYLNAVLKASGTNLKTTQPTAEHPLINNLLATTAFFGNSGVAGETYTDGAVDEPAVYNYPLTATEIERHYGAITSNYYTADTYTNMTSLARRLEFSRGRQRELERVEAGTLTARFRDTGRDLEPEYASSDYYPNVLPGRKIRWRVPSPATDLFTGYTENSPLTWLQRGALVDTRAFDALGALATWTVTGSYPAELTSARITKILNAVGWPTADRTLDTGLETVAAATLDNESALAHLQLMEESENGMLFADGSGKIVFHNRDHRTTASRSTASQATFGDAVPYGTELPYVGLTPSFDLLKVVNKVTVAWNSGVVVATDFASRGRYGERTLPRTTALSTSAAATAQAAAILAYRSAPRLRFDSMRIEPMRDSRLAAVVLALLPADRVTVKARPARDHAVITKACFVERISHVFDNESRISWSVDLALSAV